MLTQYSETQVSVNLGDKNVPTPMCASPKTYIDVLKSGMFKHRNKLYNLNELIIHLEGDNSYVLTISFIIFAQEDTPTKHVVSLTERLKQHFPDVIFVWAAESAPNK